MKEYRFDRRVPVETFRRRRAAWLRKLGILDRPWLVLGSAPDPTLPDALRGSHARIDINNVGKTAAGLGLGRADLTFRASKKSWQEHDRLDTRGLIWLRDRPTRLIRLHLLGKPYRHIGRVSALTRFDRDEIVRRVSGISLEEIGDLGKVSNGVAAACYGLFLGVPEVVLAGISLNQTGHSYDGLGRHRLQVEEDRFILAHLAGDARLSTTEPDLSAATGLRLWRTEGGA